MANTPVEGKRIIFMIDLNNGEDYGPVVCLTSNSMALAANVIDASSKCGTYKFNGVKDRTIQIEGVVIFNPDVPGQSAGAIVSAFENDTPFGWLHGPETPLPFDEYYTGVDAVFSNVTLTAPQEGAYTFSATVQLNGIPVLHQES